MLVALLFVAFSVIQTASGAGAKKDSDQNELERLEAEWNAAHVRGDAAALERIFAEDVVVVVPGMRVMTKADSLGMFTSGRMKFERTRRLKRSFASTTTVRL
jgi:ketosteroid isomerase-like protein